MESKSKLQVLLVQPLLCWQDPAENRRQLQTQIDDALGGPEVKAAADLIVLPETFTTGFLGDVKREPEPMDGDTVAWMKHMAAAHGAAIGGSVVIGENGARYNRFLFVTPDGQVTHYDKRHLFAYQGEHKRYTAGNRRVVVPFRGWRICLQVCYDLRFPAWCRVRDDYDLLLFVANWPAKRVNAWTSLIKARAIENQAYAIGVNRVGEDGNGLEYPGQSVAFDPLGAELACLGAEADTALVALELDSLHRLRTELPFLADADEFELKI
jgi:predicted amidohydrolase